MNWVSREIDGVAEMLGLEWVQGAFTGVCSKAHVPSFLKHADSLKGKGAEDIICVSVNDPYTINAWAEKLGAKDKVISHGISLHAR